MYKLNFRIILKLIFPIGYSRIVVGVNRKIQNQENWKFFINYYCKACHKKRKNKDLLTSMISLAPQISLSHLKILLNHKKLIHLKKQRNWSMKNGMKNKRNFILPSLKIKVKNSDLNIIVEFGKFFYRWVILWKIKIVKEILSNVGLTTKKCSRSMAAFQKSLDAIMRKKNWRKRKSRRKTKKIKRKDQEEPNCLLLLNRKNLKSNKLKDWWQRLKRTLSWKKIS